MTCSICDGEPRRLATTKNGYELLRCTNCSLVYCDPMPTPDELNAYYQGFAYARPSAGALERQIRYTRKGTARFAATARALAKRPIAHVLDYGGGLGFFASALAQEFEAVTLFDLDTQARDFARTRFAGQFEIAETAETALGQVYDLILVNQVIEHVPDPAAFLRGFGAALAPGGVLIVTTPNNDSNDAFMRPDVMWHYLRKLRTPKMQALKLMATDSWLCCDPPRHLFAFNVDNLAQLARKAGLNPRQLTTAYFDDDPFGQPKYPFEIAPSKRAIAISGLNIFTKVLAAGARAAGLGARRGTTLIGYFTQ